MSCCDSLNDTKDKKKVGTIPDGPPKSIVGKYLYNVGKKESEKKKKDKKGGCC